MFRTLAFRFAGTYALIFTLFVSLILGIVYIVATQEIRGISEREIQYDMQALRSAYNTGGISQLSFAISEHAEGAPGDDFYLLAENGRIIAGNIPAEVWHEGWQEMRLPHAIVQVDQDLKDAAAMNSDDEVRLFSFGETMGPYQVLAGRNSHILHETQEIVLFCLLVGSIAIAIGALVTGFALSREPAARVNAILALTRQVTSGRFDGRLPVKPRGDEIDRLAEHINVMVARIERLMDSLRQVSTDIAHDLRTPLARLRQRLDRLQSHPPTAAEFDAAMDDAIAEADGIIETFNALLRIAQVEAGVRRERFRTTDLSALTARICDIYGAVAADAGHMLTLDMDDALQVAGDPDLLTQMMANLIENAINHAPAPARIAVTVQGQADGSVLWRIQDDGPGIPEAEHKNVFRRLYRLNSSRSTPGNGLGLSMVAAIADLHRATVRLDDAAPGLRVSLRFAGLVDKDGGAGRNPVTVDDGNVGKAG